MVASYQGRELLSSRGKKGGAWQLRPMAALVASRAPAREPLGAALAQRRMHGHRRRRVRLQWCAGVS